MQQVTSAVRAEALEGRTLLSVAVVTTEADSGPGSFRAAVERANADSAVGSIAFSPTVDTVRLASPVTFTGRQDLSVLGNRAAVEPASGGEGDFDLFVVTGGGDLTLNAITFRKGSDGVVVRLPADATGTVNVRLPEVSLTDNAEFGLHVDDLTNASAASINLSLFRTSILRNGTAALDKDGVRVDERGAGGINASVVASRLNGNGAEGIELDEGGDGGVTLSATASTFNDNGFFSEEDLDDGIDVDEADAGDVRVSLRAVQVNGNLDEGVDLNESGEGSLFLSATSLQANDNTDEGVALEETDAGDIVADLLSARIEGNGADGFQAEEGGAGNLLARVFASRITGNDGFGIKAVQELPGRGLLLLLGVDLSGNTDGAVDAENVRVFRSGVRV